MKSVRTLLNSFIFAGLALGAAGSAFASHAPAIQPKPSRGVLSYLGSGLWYSLTHPKLTLPVTAGLGLYYLYSCRSNSRNWTPEIQAAETETLSFDATSDAVDTQRSLFRNWKLKPGSASELAANWQETYRNLRRDFSLYADKAEFVRKNISKIDTEKTVLKQNFVKLDRCLAKCNLLPRTHSYHPIFDNPVLVIVNNYMKEQNCQNFYHLSAAQIDFLNKKIERLTNFSVFSLFNSRPWKTFNWHRLYALPYEADAIEQYWKTYQMVAHLDALQYCLNQALADNTLV